MVTITFHAAAETGLDPVTVEVSDLAWPVLDRIVEASDPARVRLVVEWLDHLAVEILALQWSADAEHADELAAAAEQLRLAWVPTDPDGVPFDRAQLVLRLLSRLFADSEEPPGRQRIVFAQAAVEELVGRPDDREFRDGVVYDTPTLVLARRTLAVLEGEWPADG